MSNKNKKTISNPLLGTLAEEVNKVANPSDAGQKDSDNPKTEADRVKNDADESFAGAFIENCLTFDGSNKGKPVFVPTQLIDTLQKYSEKYNRRLSVRAMVSSLIQTFIDNGGEKIIDEFMDRIHYVPLTKEELKKRKEAAEKAKKLRAAAKEAIANK